MPYSNPGADTVPVATEEESKQQFNPSSSRTETSPSRQTGFTVPTSRPVSHQDGQPARNMVNPSMPNE